MRMKSLLASASLPLALFTTAANAADCRPVFVDSNPTVFIDGVEIDAMSFSRENFQLRVRNEADNEPSPQDRCEATIRVSRIDPTPPPGLPPFLLTGPGNQNIEILPDAVSGGTPNSDIRIANAPVGPQGRAVPFGVAFKTEWGLRSGTYTEQLLLTLVDQNDQVVDTATLTITITVPDVVSIRLYGAVIGGGQNGPASIDLGNLSSLAETRSDPFGALIFSTSPYIVAIQSGNLGDLRHEQGLDQIPYELYFDNQRVNLSALSEFPYFSQSLQSGDRRPMRITVPPKTATAGSYSDRISISVTAM